MTLTEAKDTAMRARQSFRRIEDEWNIAKEAGVSMSVEFWAAFGQARWTADDAVNQVAKTREEEQKRAEAVYSVKNHQRPAR